MSVKVELNAELLIAQKNSYIDELLASNETKRKVIHEVEKWLINLHQEIDLKDSYHNKHIKIGAKSLLEFIRSKEKSINPTLHEQRG